jgi:C4-dicarboxylate-specific signal transduction histidine kinase
MQTRIDQLTRARQLSFMGKITASLSHEIKNTLAIISQSAGLMGDLLDQSPPAEWATLPRLKSITASIEDQVQRSGALVKQLNRLAHSMDKALVAVDLNDLVQDITKLMQRLARLQNVDLEARPAAAPVPIISDPFRVQYLLFFFIERALQSPRKHTKVTVAAGSSADAVPQVTITDQGPPRAELPEELMTMQLTPESVVAQGQDPEVAVLATTMGELKVRMSAGVTSDQGNEVVLSFPTSIDGA